MLIRIGYYSDLPDQVRRALIRCVPGYIKFDDEDLPAAMPTLKDGKGIFVGFEVTSIGEIIWLCENLADMREAVKRKRKDPQTPRLQWYIGVVDRIKNQS